MGHANRILALHACCQLRRTAKWSIEAYGSWLVEVMGVHRRSMLSVCLVLSHLQAVVGIVCNSAVYVSYRAINGGMMGFIDVACQTCVCSSRLLAVVVRPVT